MVIALATAATALAAPGDLAYKDCITGETESGPTPGSGACDVLPGAASFGANSGLNDVTGGAVSPDGKSLYAVGQSDDAIVHFSRNPKNGKLTFEGCLTGFVGVTACDVIPDADGVPDNSGLSEPEDVEVSRDGKSVYLAAEGDAAVAWFKRAGNGDLTYKGCLTGEFETVSPDCVAVPGVAAMGTNGNDSGLAGAHDLVVAPNGKAVYLAADLDDSLVRFKRSTSSGELTFKSCLTGEKESGPAGSDACDSAPDEVAGGLNAAMNNLESLAITSDGESLYGTAPSSSAIVEFSPAPFTFERCITGSSTVAGGGVCDAIPNATADGLNSGLGGLEGIVASRDGKSVYVSAESDAAVVHLKRQGNGSLKLKGCISGDSSLAVCDLTGGATADGNDSGMGNAQIPAISPDGRSVYVPSEDDAVNHFKRDTGSGELAYKGCITGETESGPLMAGSGACDDIPSDASTGTSSGLDEPESVIVSPDSKWLYSFAQNDDAVGRFKRAR